MRQSTLITIGMMLLALLISACNVVPEEDLTTTPFDAAPIPSPDPRNSLSTPDTPETEIAGVEIPIWMGSEDPIDESSIAIGCGTYITPIEAGVTAPDDLAVHIQTSLETLFNTPADDTLNNQWAEQNLTVDAVLVNPDGQVDITISGDFSLIGTCADAEMQAQILQSIFVDPAVDSAFVLINGDNLKRIFDMSGTTLPDSVFTPDDIPYVQ